MTTHSRRQSFRIRGKDNADKYLLGFVFVAGICGSLVLKGIGAPVWLPALFSGSLIVVYAIIASLLPRTQLESDQIGDNAYYLGFVLTLTSLAHTLYQLAGHSGQTEFISDVISGFGIALSSTIVGVTVRVICLQFRLDLVARDREARLALNDAMRLFRSEIADAIRGVKYLGIEIRQTLTEHHVELSEDRAQLSQRIHGEILEAFNRGLEPISGRLGTITHEIFENADAALKNSQDVRMAAQTSLKDSFEQTVSDLKESVAKISIETQQSLSLTSGQISDLNSTIKAQLEAAASSLQENGGIIVDIASVTNEKMFDTSRKSLEQASAAFHDEGKKLSATLNANSMSVHESADRTAKGLDTLSISIENQINRLKDMPDLNERLKTDFSIQIRGLSEAIESLKSEIGMARETGQLSQARETNTDGIVASLEPANR